MSKPSKALLADLRAFVAGLSPAQRTALRDLLSFENTSEALWFVLDSQYEKDQQSTDTQVPPITSK